MRTFAISCVALLAGAVPAQAATLLNVTLQGGGWRWNSCYPAPGCEFQTNLTDDYSFDVTVPDELPINQDYVYDFGEIETIGWHRGIIRRIDEATYISPYGYFHIAEPIGLTWRVTTDVDVRRVYETPKPAVPESSTWAMMILGFGAIGYVMRRKAMPGFVRP